MENNIPTGVQDPADSEGGIVYNGRRIGCKQCKDGYIEMTQQEIEDEQEAKKENKNRHEL